MQTDLTPATSTYCAIITKTMPPTDTRGQRIDAYYADGSGTPIRLGWLYDRGHTDNHARAASACLEANGETARVVGADIGTGRMAWVIDD